MPIPTAPKVSIIVSTYNRASMLKRAVDSVLAQSFTDYELLIVDDCSADETPEVVAGLEDPRIRSFRHSSNRGVGAARNTGIANAHGEYIAFLDDDDEYLPAKIEEQVRVLDAASADVGMVYVWCASVGPDGKIIDTLCRMDEGYLFEEALTLRLILGIGTSSMIRSSALKDVGCFDESLPLGEDLDFLCMLARRYKIALVPEILVKLHRGHPQMSAPSRNTSICLRDYILSHQARFRTDIGKRRRVRSSLWRTLAIVELSVGNRLGAFRAVFMAFLADPITGYLAIKWLVTQIVGALGRFVRSRPHSKALE